MNKKINHAKNSMKKKKKKNTEIYISVDIETDGPIPGPHSMLSFGAAAFTADGTMVDTFTRNLELLDGASAHPDTDRFWNENPIAFKTTRTNLTTPGDAIGDFIAWVDALNGRAVFVAYPAGFDFTFMYWYMIRFAGRSPFSFSALDMKSFAMVLLDSGYRDATKRAMPRRWFSKRRHTHVALDDAIEQGELFANMLAERDKLHRSAGRDQAE